MELTISLSGMRLNVQYMTCQHTDYFRKCLSISPQQMNIFYTGNVLILNEVTQKRQMNEKHFLNNVSWSMHVVICNHTYNMAGLHFVCYIYLRE